MSDLDVQLVREGAREGARDGAPAPRPLLRSAGIAPEWQSEPGLALAPQPPLDRSASAPPAPPIETEFDAPWNLVLPRGSMPALAAGGSAEEMIEDIELLASNLCAALSQQFKTKWLLCEVFQADAETESKTDQFEASIAAPLGLMKAAPALRLRLGVTPDRECYGCMRPPRGHCCTRCLDLPLARVLRKGVETTFTPGVGLVGRCWTSRRAEVLDLAVARCFPAAYARTAAWDVGHLRTVVAVPVARREAWGNGEITHCEAVVLVYFGNAFLCSGAEGSGDVDVLAGVSAAIARTAAAVVKRQKAQALRRPVSLQSLAKASSSASLAKHPQARTASS
ncbi:hypothetical protein M885DRAFT_547520 [Pelagophyceae sp. CCMP2097]|nr:hypothetical protein M885DRAFT_547520 [Pelagophyceae sp. CCMP2097]